MKKYLLIILSSIIGGIIAVYMYEKLTTEVFKKEKISNLVLTEQFFLIASLSKEFIFFKTGFRSCFNCSKV